MPLSTIAVIISIAGTLFSILFGISTVRRNSRQDNREEGIILNEIGYIKSGIDDIKKKQSDYDVFQRELTEKFGRMDESIKSAHHRIDGLSEEVKELHQALHLCGN